MLSLMLRSGQYRPFRKPNRDPLTLIAVITIQINHVPDSIARRLSDISSSSDALPEYENAQHNSGFTKKLAYSERAPNQQENKRTRRRKILWYNPRSASRRMSAGNSLIGCACTSTPTTAYAVSSTPKL